MVFFIDYVMEYMAEIVLIQSQLWGTWKWTVCSFEDIIERYKVLNYVQILSVSLMILER